MDINYYMKIQNAYGTRNRREKELIKVNHEMSKHFEDTFGTEDVLINGIPAQLMIIKDTDGNTYKKKIKSRQNDKFNLGDYVEWNGQIWLITLVDVDERTWNRGYMYLCTVPLRWQNAEGKIIERYAYSEDFTKYSSGVTGNSTITIGDNQYGLTIPTDEETKLLNRDMRFPIDFEDSKQPDIYTLTNRKVSLSNNEYFDRGGIITLTLSFDAFNANTDKRVVMDNGKEVWICNYNNQSSLTPPQPSEPDKTTDLTATISGNKELKVGFNRTYTVEFANKETGEPVDWSNIKFTWNVDATFDVKQTVNESKITVSVGDDESLIGSSFILQCIVNEVVVGQIVIEIMEVG